MPRSEYDQWVDQYIDACRRDAEYQAWLEWSDSLQHDDGPEEEE